MDKLSGPIVMVFVEGEKFVVLEDLKWSDDSSRKIVLTPNGERMIKKIGGHWFWCTQNDMRVGRKENHDFRQYT